MSSDTTARLNGSAPADPDELRAEIARTREDLGQTAAALAAKTDVKARFRAKAAGLAGRTTALAGTVRERAQASGLADRTTALASGVAGRSTALAGAVRERAVTTVRRPVPVAVVAAVASAAVVALVLVRRSRH